MLNYTWCWLDGYESQLSWFLVSRSKSCKNIPLSNLVELVFLSFCMIRHFQHDSTSFHFDAFPVLFLSLSYLTLFMIKKKSVCLDRQYSSFQKTFTLTYHHLHYITGVVVCHPYKLSFKYNVLNIPFAHTALLTPMNIYINHTFQYFLLFSFIHTVPKETGYWGQRRDMSIWRNFFQKGIFNAARVLLLSLHKL